MSSQGRVAVLAGLALAVWFTVIVAEHGWNPSTLMAAGSQDLPVVSYVEASLGPDFEPQAGWGHDGKFVFIQAHDPLLLDPLEHAAVLDVPVYRSQRVLVPALVGIGSVFGSWGVVWAFPVVMVLAVMVGAWATAGLVERMGGSPWFGIAFLFNPGLFYSYRRGTVDVAAVALLVLGVYLVSLHRYRPAGLTLAAAVLAKEVMVLGAIGLALHVRRDGRRVIPVAAGPAVAVLVWGVYVRLRLGEAAWTTGVDTLTGPFQGVIPVVIGYPAVSSVVALVVLGWAGLTVIQAVRQPNVALSAALGFALLLPVLPEAVWVGYVDAWRAAAPLYALGLVCVASGRAGSRRRPARETEPAPA